MLQDATAARTPTDAVSRLTLLIRTLTIATLIAFGAVGSAMAQSAPTFELLPELSLGGEDTDYALPIQLLLLLTVLHYQG